MANVGDLMRLYGNAGPSQVLWQAQLAVQESGVSRQDIQGALQRFDDRLSRLSSMADATPGVVNGIVRDARTRFDATFADMMGTIRSEGATLTASMSSERAAATAALDVERAAVAADAARISEQVVRQAGAEVRRLVREALLLLIALAVVLLGLPFAAGYAVGRARGGSRPG
jgi:conjugal transfer/entry exclusion protein